VRASGTQKDTTGIYFDFDNLDEVDDGRELIEILDDSADGATEATKVTHQGLSCPPPPPTPPTLAAPDDNDDDVGKLWAQLSQCGRLPLMPMPELAGATLRLWLGDFAGALEMCRVERSSLMRGRLIGALQRFVGQLPIAEARSGAFRPWKIDRASAQRDLIQGVRASTASSVTDSVVPKCGVYRASDGVEIGYVLLSRRGGGTGEEGLLLHWGGNEEVAAMTAATGSPLHELVAARSLDAVLVDFRGCGWSGGRASLATLRCDAADLHGALPELLGMHGLAWPRSGPLIVMGRSLGSHCALHFAILHAEKIDALVLDSPCSCHWPLHSVAAGLWAQLSKHLPPLRPCGRELSQCPCCCAAVEAQSFRESVWLDPVDIVKSLNMKLLVLAAREDDVCPRRQVEAFFAASAAEDKQLVWILNWQHHDVWRAPMYRASLRVFLDDVSKKRRGDCNRQGSTRARLGARPSFSGFRTKKATKTEAPFCTQFGSRFQA